MNLTVLGSKTKKIKLTDLRLPVDSPKFYGEGLFFRIVHPAEVERPSHFWIYMLPTTGLEIVKNTNGQDSILLPVITNHALELIPIDTEIELVTIEEIRVRIYAR